MREAPKTMSELRKMLAETLHDVRYGHISAQQGIAVAKVASQIANLINVEMNACKMLSEFGQEHQALGDLPISNAEPKRKQTIGEAS